MNTKIKYTSIAAPPNGVVISQEYLFGKDAKGYFYGTVEHKEYAELAFIKSLFTPVDATWDEVLKVGKTNTKVNTSK